MARYFVNNGTDNKGDHEVHRQGCHVMPADRTDLGEHSNCQSAVRKAKQIYSNSNGCIHCSGDCHTT